MTKAALHELVDEIPDAEVERIAALVRAVRADDQAVIRALTAPVEPVEDFELAALDEAAKDDPADAIELEEYETHR
jgi:hypothetical protein